MSSQSSQLHNPRSVWFLGAPLSKAMALSTAVIYVAAEMKHWHESMVFGETIIHSTLFAVVITFR
jgi:hypothetical protein